MNYGQTTIHLKPVDPQQGEISINRAITKPQWDAIGDVLSNPDGGNAAHWKANHDAQVARARVLVEREDLPLERVKAYQYMLELDEETKRLHRELAAERLRADQGWQRYEAANAAKNALEMEKTNFATVEHEARRFAACRHQARHMQEDGGERVFVAKVDQYIRDNKL